MSSKLKVFPREKMIDGGLCYFLFKEDVADGFIPEKKKVKDLLPGECTRAEDGKTFVGRSSIIRGHENDNTWYFWEI